MSDNEAEFTEENNNQEEVNLEDSVIESNDTVSESELEKYKAESQINFDGWQRTKADFANLKKRSAEDVLKTTSRAAEGFIESLLPTLDSFDMAFKDKEAWELAPEQWRKGIEYIYAQLTAVLDSYGVSKVGSAGEVFNHEIHEPIESIPVENESEDNTIKEVVRSGYKMKETVIRPAHVKVGIFEKEH